MVLRDRRCCVSMLALALAAALAGCQNVRVKLGEPPSASAGGPAAAPAPQPSFPNPGNIPGGQVSVRRSETIYQVSQRTGAPVRDLIDANHLRPPYRLAAGTNLVVPRTPTHVVQRGETLYSIAEAEGVELYSLARMNELTPPFAVTQGEVLKLPPTVARPLASARPLPAPPPGKPDIQTTRLAPVGTSSGAPPGPPAEEPEVASLPPPAQTPAAPATEAPQAALPVPPPRAGRFLWPVRGRVVGRFGTAASGTHNDGINIAAPKGTPVRAADAGVVAYAGNELRGYGNLVLIKHAGGWMTAYAHNETILVRRGEVVKRGQEIAKVGATGIVSEPQLHFEIRKGTRVLDPSQYLPGSQASAGR
ncbi:MAG: LysM peptidoglycan-binding domain-containing M23 family metallopeptidase [Alphaproteobacteria bacterium]|nr:LysM peptidoglycan-binding domain-containing M23 family metallopeptidase [Alphaproteobacteria bacterium]